MKFKVWEYDPPSIPRTWTPCETFGSANNSTITSREPSPSRKRTPLQRKSFVTPPKKIANMFQTELKEHSYINIAIPSFFCYIWLEKIERVQEIQKKLRPCYMYRYI